LWCSYYPKKKETLTLPRGGRQGEAQKNRGAKPTSAQGGQGGKKILWEC